jgi:hypothetical protein
MTRDTTPCPPPGEDRDTLVVPMLRPLPAAGWFYVQSFTSADRLPPTPPTPRRCSCGGSGECSDRWDEGQRKFRTFTMCCSAECDRLGCRLEDS